MLLARNEEVKSLSITDFAKSSPGPPHLQHDNSRRARMWGIFCPGAADELLVGSLERS